MAVFFPNLRRVRWHLVKPAVCPAASHHFAITALVDLVCYFGRHHSFLHISIAVSRNSRRLSGFLHAIDTTNLSSISCTMIASLSGLSIVYNIGLTFGRFGIISPFC